MSTTPPAAENVTGAASPAYAGFWLRVGAAVIDTITLFVPWCWTFFISIAVMAFAIPRYRFNGDTLKLIALFAASFIAPLLYFTLLEYSKWQATIGKLIFRLRVTDVQGRRLSFGRALLRNLAKWVSTLTLGIGYVICGFTPKKRALHDFLAGSVVLRVPRS
jgi:uncharacterized RDD family membrane protein YckC